MDQNERRNPPPSDPSNGGAAGDRSFNDGIPAGVLAFGTGEATRRGIVKAGVKIAYVAPAVAASFGLTRGGALARTRKKGSGKSSTSNPKPGDSKPPKGATKIAICHATCSDTNPYVLIEIDDNAVDQHLKNHHKNAKCPNQDVVLGPVSEGSYTIADCPGGAIST